MRVLVDTPIWSLALRRRTRTPDDPATAELASLIQDGRAALIGPVRQELLSGIRERVHRISGQLTIKAAPAGGTCLCVVVPIPETARQAQPT